MATRVGLCCAVPTPDYLHAKLGYSTRRYRVPAHLAHLADEWDLINIMGYPVKGTFTGVFSFIENKIAEMLLYRPGGDYPPTNGDEFEQAVAQLPNPIISEMLRDFEPLGSPRSYHVDKLYRHHYEQMEQWPVGLLVLGDAFVIYDPIFGQGMTVTAMQVEMLKFCLQAQQSNPQPQFEPAWWLNCVNDLQWLGVKYEGVQPLQGSSFG
jgi:hypothetical protein